MEGIYGNLSSLWDLTDLIISKDIVSAYCHYWQIFNHNIIIMTINYKSQLL